jgi:hypothetical protein
VNVTVLSKVGEFNVIYVPFKNVEYVCEIKNQVSILCLTLFDRFNGYVFNFTSFMKILKVC